MQIMQNMKPCKICKFKSQTTKPNFQNKTAKPTQPKQTYQTKPANLDLPKQTYQAKYAKLKCVSTNFQ